MCYNQPFCSPRKDIEAYFYPVIPKLQYVFVNSSVEYSKAEMKNPVKQFTDDSLFWPVELQRQVQTNLYLRDSKLSMNESWYKFGQKHHRFHKFEDIREYYQPWSFPKSDQDDLRLNRVFVRLDDKIDYIEVRLYGLLDFISNLGGLSSFLYEAGLVLAKFLAYDLFIASLMKLLFTI